MFILLIAVFINRFSASFFREFPNSTLRFGKSITALTAFPATPLVDVWFRFGRSYVFFVCFSPFSFAFLTKITAPVFHETKKNGTGVFQRRFGPVVLCVFLFHYWCSIKEEFFFRGASWRRVRGVGEEAFRRRRRRGDGNPLAVPDPNDLLRP